MPGKIAPPWRSFAIRLSRISSFTRRVLSRCSLNGLWRNSPSVRGRLMMENPQWKQLLLGLYAAHYGLSAGQNSSTTRDTNVHEGVRSKTGRGEGLSFCDLCNCDSLTSNEHGRYHRPFDESASFAVNSAGWPRSRK